MGRLPPPPTLPPATARPRYLNQYDTSLVSHVAPGWDRWFAMTSDFGSPGAWGVPPAARYQAACWAEWRCCAHMCGPCMLAAAATRQASGAWEASRGSQPTCLVPAWHAGVRCRTCDVGACSALAGPLAPLAEWHNQHRNGMTTHQLMLRTPLPITPTGWPATRQVVSGQLQGRGPCVPASGYAHMTNRQITGVQLCNCYRCNWEAAGLQGCRR